FKRPLAMIRSDVRICVKVAEFPSAVRIRVESWTATWFTSGPESLVTWTTRADAVIVPTTPISSTVSPVAARVAGGVPDAAVAGNRDGTVGVRTAVGVLALDGVAVLLFEDPPHATSAVANTAATTSEITVLCIDADYRTLPPQANEAHVTFAAKPSFTQ